MPKDMDCLGAQLLLNEYHETKKNKDYFKCIECRRETHQVYHTTLNITKHRWIPTCAFLHQQNPPTAPTCQCCKDATKDATDILGRPGPTATSYREETLYSMLTELVKTNVSIHIIQAMEQHLTEYLNIPNQNKYQAQFHSVGSSKIPQQLLNTKT